MQITGLEVAQIPTGHVLFSETLSKQGMSKCRYKYEKLQYKTSYNITPKKFQRSLIYVMERYYAI